MFLLNKMSEFHKLVFAKEFIFCIIRNPEERTHHRLFDKGTVVMLTKRLAL